jgi:hypothetical protein
VASRGFIGALQEAPPSQAASSIGLQIQIILNATAFATGGGGDSLGLNA